MADKITQIGDYRSKPAPEKPAPSLKTGDDDGTSGSMNGLSERLARLEGGTDTLKWSVAVVSAAIVGAAAVILVLQGVTLSRVAGVETKVDALPEQINRNLLELNRTLSASITAAQGSRAPTQPTIIFVPQGAIGQGAPEPPK